MLLEFLRYTQLYSLFLALWGVFIIVLIFSFGREFFETRAGKFLVGFVLAVGGWFVIVSAILVVST